MKLTTGPNYLLTTLPMMSIGIMMLLSGMVFITPNQNYSFIMKAISAMFTLKKMLTLESKMTYNLKGTLMIFNTVFIFLLSINFMGLVPYYMSHSSQAIFVFTLAFPLWSFLILSSILTNMGMTLASFLPGGAPMLLNPFLTMVELVSIMVRPLTLSVRLLANMNAGHLILILCSGYCNKAFNMNLMENMFKITPLILSIINTLYLMFETFICAIQVYIFCMLLSLYTEDHAISKSKLFLLKYN